MHEAMFVVVSVATNGSSVVKCGHFGLLSSPVNDLPFPDRS